MRNRTLRNVFVCVTVLGAMAVGAIAAVAPGPSGNGHGTLIVTNASNGNSVRRQFSFSARQAADGTVSGSAIVNNPAYTGNESTQHYMLQVDISCMKVIGNVAFFGGTTRRTNEAGLIDAVYFSVEDNGQPGRNSDRISDAVFYDDDPNTTGDPALCQGIQIGNFPMNTIEAGNIVLRP